jgi:DNA-binding transcriptional LysR family regulator
MNLAAVDLNLLVAFQSLMEERHVTRAGQRVGLAQPSMSSALNRLRVLFNDELFVRTAAGMQPTAKALSLARPVSEALGQIKGILDPETPFDPKTARHRFTIAATDYGDLVIVPRLVESLRREAPGVDLRVRAITNALESLTLLERGEIDALVGGHLPDTVRTVRHTLFNERFVCIRDTKLAESAPHLSAADYARFPHALFSSTGGDGAPSAIDTILKENGSARRIALTPPHIVAVPFAVANTDLIASMAERVARTFAQVAGVTIVPLPYDVPAFAIDLLCARRATSNTSTQWLMDLIVATCGSL